MKNEIKKEERDIFENEDIEEVGIEVKERIEEFGKD